MWKGRTGATIALLLAAAALLGRAEGEDQERSTRDLQRHLNAFNKAYGHPALTTDDIFGPKTAAAVKAFQKAHGLRETGVADQATWTALRSQSPPTPRLETGDDGADVHRLQLLLNTYAREHGLPRIESDGVFGRETRAAVRAAQRAAGLPETGVADRNLWQALDPGMTQAAPPDEDDDDATPPKPGEAGALPEGAVAIRASDDDMGYLSHYKSGRRVWLHRLKSWVKVNEKDGKPVYAQPYAFRSGEDVDADGSGDAWRRDPDGQRETTLQSHGRSLDPTVTPYVVLPIGFEKAHPGVRIGDIVVMVRRIERRDPETGERTIEKKIVSAIYGDRGPRGALGEASIKSAKGLAVNPDPVRGGTDRGIEYFVFPGSGDGKVLSPEEIERRGAALIAQRPPKRPKGKGLVETLQPTND